MPEHIPDRSDRTDRWARLCALAYAAAGFAMYCFWKASLAERSGDPAIFENMLWNASHGNGLKTALEGGRHHLAVHFSPILYLFVPPYALVPSLHVLHAAVALGTAAAGYLLFRRFRPTLGPTAAALGVGAFLFHPTIVLQNFMEFHELALAPLAVIGLLLAHEARRIGGVVLAGLALVAIREDTAILLAAIGLAALLFDRERRRLGVVEIGLAILGVALFLGVGIGWLGHGQVAGVFTGTYSTWGSSPREAVGHVLTHPGAVARHVFSRTVVSYLAQLSGPFLGPLALASPWAWAALPYLVLIAMADPGSRLPIVRMHYSIVPACLIAFAALQAVERLSGAGRFRLPGRPAAWTGAMLAITLLIVPLWSRRVIERLNPWPREVRAVLALVPDSASVTAPSYLTVELARRPDLGYARNDGIDWNDYVLIEDGSRKFYPGESIDTFYTPALGESLARRGYAPIATPAGWHLWRRTPGE